MAVGAFSHDRFWPSGTRTEKDARRDGAVIAEEAGAAALDRWRDEMRRRGEADKDEEEEAVLVGMSRRVDAERASREDDLGSMAEKGEG